MYESRPGPSGASSVEDKPLMVADYAPANALVPHARVLVVGGTIGAEFSSVSVVFKWMALLSAGQKGTV